MLSFVTLVWFILCVWLVLCLIMMILPDITPDIFAHFFLYGKLRGLQQAKTSTSTFLLFPKRWFTYFYGNGFIVIGSAFGLSIYSCYYGGWPDKVHDLVAMLRYPGNFESYADSYSTVIVLGLATFQVARRYLECKLVSVYSKGHISIMTLLAGMGFYTFLPFTALAGTNLTQCPDFFRNIKGTHIVGTLLFIWASLNQHVIAKQFSKLRHDKSGQVENTKHHIPHGGYFDLVSSPHFLMEILIYLALNIIYGFQNTMFIGLFFFVLFNQMLMGYYTHQWYRKEFPKYPKNRKAIIPYLI